MLITEQLFRSATLISVKINLPVMKFDLTPLMRPNLHEPLGGSTVPDLHEKRVDTVSFEQKMFTNSFRHSLLFFHYG